MPGRCAAPGCACGGCDPPGPTSGPRCARPAVKPPLVVHVVYRFDTGGLENGVVNLINHLPADRFRHVVICMTDHTGFAARISIDRSLLSDPGQLVAYGPGTASGDTTRPDFILSQLTTASYYYSPQTGVGTSTSSNWSVSITYRRGSQEPVRRRACVAWRAANRRFWTAGVRSLAPTRWWRGRSMTG